MLALRQRFSTHDEYLAWADTRPPDERYEIVEGRPVMSPGPGYSHQSLVVELLVLLRSACPPGYVVLPAPFDWVLWELPTLQVREPDLLVIPRPADRRIRRIETAPLLAVEILSPASVEIDLFIKRREYARAGLQHYWVVDPDGPGVAIYRRDGADDMTLVTEAVGDQRLALSEPFELSFAPADLLR